MKVHQANVDFYTNCHFLSLYVRSNLVRREFVTRCSFKACLFSYMTCLILRESFQEKLDLDCCVTSPTKATRQNFPNKSQQIIHVIKPL